jgi:rhamnosyltransferase
MTSALPRVAVMLAAHNGERFLQEQVDSILAQEGVDVTVFASVDPGSDGTRDRLAAAARADSRIRLLPDAGRFGGAAPNFFRLLRDVDAAAFDALAFADQDDRWYAGKLERALTEISRVGAAGYSGNVIAFWEDGRTLEIDKAQAQRKWDHLFESAGPGCTYVLTPGLATAAQRLAREQPALLEGIEYHDWFVYALARTRGERWVIDPQPQMLYRQHAANQLGANAGWAAVQRRVRQVLSGSALVQAARVARAVGAWESPVVRRGLRGGRLGLLWLASQAGNCRRRPRDRWLFALSCIALACAPSLSGRREWR